MIKINCRRVPFGGHSTFFVAVMYTLFGVQSIRIVCSNYSEGATKSEWECLALDAGCHNDRITIRECSSSIYKPASLYIFIHSDTLSKLS